MNNHRDEEKKEEQNHKNQQQQHREKEKLIFKPRVFPYWHHTTNEVATRTDFTKQG